jgi:large subunit ribosomal protein L35
MARQKLKTRRAAAKRYRVTGSGHIKIAHKGKRHIFTNKSRKRKRQLVGMALLDPVDVPMARRLLPYSGK